MKEGLSCHYTMAESRILKLLKSGERPTGDDLRELTQNISTGKSGWESTLLLVMARAHTHVEDDDDMANELSMLLTDALHNAFDTPQNTIVMRLVYAVLYSMCVESCNTMNDENFMLANVLNNTFSKHSGDDIVLAPLLSLWCQDHLKIEQNTLCKTASAFMKTFAKALAEDDVEDIRLASDGMRMFVTNDTSDNAKAVLKSSFLAHDMGVNIRTWLVGRGDVVGQDKYDALMEVLDMLYSLVARDDEPTQDADKKFVMTRLEFRVRACLARDVVCTLLDTMVDVVPHPEVDDAIHELAQTIIAKHPLQFMDDIHNKDDDDDDKNVSGWTQEFFTCDMAKEWINSVLVIMQLQKNHSNNPVRLLGLLMHKCYDRCELLYYVLSKAKDAIKEKSPHRKDYIKAICMAFPVYDSEATASLMSVIGPCLIHFLDILTDVLVSDEEGEEDMLHLSRPIMTFFIQSFSDAVERAIDGSNKSSFFDCITNNQSRLMDRLLDDFGMDRVVDERHTFPIVLRLCMLGQLFVTTRISTVADTVKAKRLAVAIRSMQHRHPNVRKKNICNVATSIVYLKNVLDSLVANNNKFMDEEHEKCTTFIGGLLYRLHNISMTEFLGRDINDDILKKKRAKVNTNGLSKDVLCEDFRRVLCDEDSKVIRIWQICIKSMRLRLLHNVRRKKNLCTDIHLDVLDVLATQLESNLPVDIDDEETVSTVLLVLATYISMKKHHTPEFHTWLLVFKSGMKNMAKMDYEENITFRVGLFGVQRWSEEEDTACAVLNVLNIIYNSIDKSHIPRWMACSLLEHMSSAVRSLRDGYNVGMDTVFLASLEMFLDADDSEGIRMVCMLLADEVKNATQERATKIILCFGVRGVSVKMAKWFARRTKDAMMEVCTLLLSLVNKGYSQKFDHVKTCMRAVVCKHIIEDLGQLLYDVAMECESERDIGLLDVILNVMISLVTVSPSQFKRYYNTIRMDTWLRRENNMKPEMTRQWCTLAMLGIRQNTVSAFVLHGLLMQECWNEDLFFENIINHTKILLQENDKRLDGHTHNLKTQLDGFVWCGTMMVPVFAGRYEKDTVTSHLNKHFEEYFEFLAGLLLAEDGRLDDMVMEGLARPLLAFHVQSASAVLMQRALSLVEETRGKMASRLKKDLARVKSVVGLTWPKSVLYRMFFFAVVFGRAGVRSRSAIEDAKELRRLLRPALDVCEGNQDIPYYFFACLHAFVQNKEYVEPTDNVLKVLVHGHRNTVHQFLKEDVDKSISMATCLVQPTKMGPREVLASVRWEHDYVTLKVCDGCGKEGAYYFCGGCACVRYCNAECQKVGWKDGNHRRTCPGKVHKIFGCC